MSTQPESTGYPCSEKTCTETFENGVRGSFCSTECYDRHEQRKEAQDILNQLKYDHRFCFTCFRRLKQIEPPKPDWAFGFGQEETIKASVGFEYTTENVVACEKSISQDEYGRDTNIKTGAGCKCGNTSHIECVDELRERFKIEYTHFLTIALDAFQTEGKMDQDCNIDVLFEYVANGESVEDALIEAL